MFLFKNPSRVFEKLWLPGRSHALRMLAGKHTGMSLGSSVSNRHFGIFLCHLNRNVRKVDGYPFDS